MYSPKMNAHYKYMHDHPDEFLSSDDEMPQPADDEETVENFDPPDDDEFNQQNVARCNPRTKEPDSGDLLDVDTVDYTKQDDDSKPSAKTKSDNSLDDDRKLVAK